MTGERHLEDQAGGTYGSAEAAMGWRRSSAARAQLLAPLTERMLDLAQVGVAATGTAAAGAMLTTASCGQATSLMGRSAVR